jgi:hypothetical protein
LKYRLPFISDGATAFTVIVNLVGEARVPITVNVAPLAVCEVIVDGDDVNCFKPLDVGFAERARGIVEAKMRVLSAVMRTTPN